jgi:hypothetical protein
MCPPHEDVPYNSIILLCLVPDDFLVMGRVLPLNELKLTILHVTYARM